MNFILIKIANKYNILSNIVKFTFRVRRWCPEAEKKRYIYIFFLKEKEIHTYIVFVCCIKFVEMNKITI